MIQRRTAEPQNIEPQNVEGKGKQSTIINPKVEPQNSMINEMRSPMEILIAEDDAVSRMLLEKVLVKLGYKVLAAENGLKAWKLFQQNRVSMVITDWIMPEMDGMTLCKKIRSSGTDYYTYIIIVTAKDQKQDLVEALGKGADDYLTKPFDPEELKARIKTGERIVLLEKKQKKLEMQLINSRNKQIGRASCRERV